MLPAVEVHSLNDWTSREVPGTYRLIFLLHSLGINFTTYCVSVLSNVHAINTLHLVLSTPHLV